MGFNTWNAYGGDIDEEMARQTVDLLVDLGLADAGYETFNLDDGWSEPERSADGRLLANRAAFPSGIASLSRYAHARGLKFGIYGDAGSKTCLGLPGSRGHERQDAQTWAEWGVDFVKYDNCYAAGGDELVGRYTAMRDALNATGRPIVYSLCEWGVEAPWLWAPQVGNSWRTTADIRNSWDSVLANLDSTIGLSRFAGLGSWNDPDMLEVGNSKEGAGEQRLSEGEERAHFALWALLKAPLLIGADLRTIVPASLAILKAREVIAVHQDPLGVAGDLVWKQGPREVYAAPLSGGARAVVLLNRAVLEYTHTHITVRWAELGIPANATAAVRDLYAEEDLGDHEGSFTASVRPHGVIVVRITPAAAVPGADEWRPWQGQPLFALHDGDAAVGACPGGQRCREEAGKRSGAGTGAALGRRGGGARSAYA